MISSKLLSEVAVAFVAQEEFDEQMACALRAIGKSLQLSRTYVFLDDNDRIVTSHAYEWHAEGMSSFCAAYLEDWPSKAFICLQQIVNEKEWILTTDITSLPPDLCVWLKPRGIQSLLIYPLLMSDGINGFISFEDCEKKRTWSEDEQDLLKTASEIISAFCERKICRAQEKVSEDNFHHLFNTIDDLIVIADLNGKILFTNPAVENKLGFAPSELREMEILDLHPCDNSEAAASAFDAMLRHENVSCPLFLQHKGGGRLMVETRVWFGHWNGHDSIFCISKDMSNEQAALQKFIKVFESAPVPAAIISVADRKFSDVNAFFLERLGYTREEVIGKTVCELAVFVDDEQRPEVAEEMLRKGSIRNVEVKIRTKAGDLLEGLISGVTIENFGQPFFLTFMADITEQVALRHRLESEQKRLRNIIEGAQMGTWEWNIQTGEMIVNERWAGILGYKLDELGPLNKNTLMQKLVHQEDLKKSDEMVRKHIAGEVDCYDLECRMRHKDQHWVWVHDRGKVIEWSPDGKPLMMFGTKTDITERKALEDRIIQISIRDSLTGVYNRRYVFERLDEIFAEHARRGRQFSISILDIDHFKSVNDTYGHQAGDYILKEFADIVNASIRPYDILGRYGGEEFIIVSVNSSALDTITLVDRIMSTVRKRVFLYHDIAIQFRFSCGMADSAEFPPGELTIEKMVELADRRLYAAKEGGRDRLEGPPSL